MASEPAESQAEQDAAPVERIVMIASVADIVAAARPWPLVRPMETEALPWLAAATWDAFPHRPPFDTWDSVVALAQAVFRGEWGEFMPVASPVAVTPDGYIAGAVATVLRVPREGAPDCPYVLNCLTLPEHRRQGVAEGLLAAAALGVAAVGETRLGLTVDEENAPARALYAKLGFVEVSRGPAGS